jgi:poly-gamma-glutamate capsule biosynthesis protein CapA/YwtB (metallophosphatase superfamily)
MSTSKTTSGPAWQIPRKPLAPIASALSAADITVVNLKTAVTDRGEPEPETYAFRIGPVAFEALAAAGVDVVTMANNHAVDYGAERLADTLAAVASAPLPVVGIGVDDEQAFAPAVLDVRGTTVALLGATGVPNSTAQATSGVLTLTVREGAIVDDAWTPTFTGQDGMPRLVTGSDA